MIDEVTDAIVAISRHFGVMDRDMICCSPLEIR